MKKLEDIINEVCAYHTVSRAEAATISPLLFQNLQKPHSVAVNRENVSINDNDVIKKTITTQEIKNEKCSRIASLVVTNKPS